jgi:hypothetical protein
MVNQWDRRSFFVVCQPAEPENSPDEDRHREKCEDSQGVGPGSARLTETFEHGKGSVEVYKECERGCKRLQVQRAAG